MVCGKLSVMSKEPRAAKDKHGVVTGLKRCYTTNLSSNL